MKDKVDPLIKDMFERLPDIGSVWPILAQEAWLEAMRAIFDLIYRVKADEERK